MNKVLVAIMMELMLDMPLIIAVSAIIYLSFHAQDFEQIMIAAAS